MPPGLHAIVGGGCWQAWSNEAAAPIDTTFMNSLHFRSPPRADDREGLRLLKTWSLIATESVRDILPNCAIAVSCKARYRRLCAFLARSISSPRSGFRAGLQIGGFAHRLSFRRGQCCDISPRVFTSASVARSSIPSQSLELLLRENPSATPNHLLASAPCSPLRAVSLRRRKRLHLALRYSVGTVHFPPPP